MAKTGAIAKLKSMAKERNLQAGGIAKLAKKAIGAASESAGMKAPVTATKDLTTLQDFHTSLGDRIRGRVAETQKMMDEWEYKYKPGQHVFTEDSAKKNLPPMRILDRARSGYQVMREDMNDPFSKKIIDPATGRAKRTPYEPGYRVRMERGPDDWSEFIIPEKSIVGDVGMQAGGLARLLNAGKGAKKTPPAAETKIIQAPTVIVPSKLSNVKEAVRQSKGDYGARRVERAADEIPNLERMYKEEGLRSAFTGDNAQALMTMNPANFERFAKQLQTRNITEPKSFADKTRMSTEDYVNYLRTLPSGFDDVPFLGINKEEYGLPLKPFISGHEGRHRSRALAQSGQPTSLVRLVPRAELREPFPRRTQEEYIQALRDELDLTGNLVMPEGGAGSAVVLPDIYAKGGEVHMKKGGKPVDPRFRTAGGDPLNEFVPPRYRSAGRRPESQNDRQASANIPVAVARGLVSGTLGMPGDIESLARLPYELITGKESKTILPTSEDIEKRLPFRGASQTPVGQMFTGASQLAGGAYTGPLSGARAVMAVPRAVRRAGQDFVQSAGQTVSPLTVYHGSPHKFEKFDASKIGTGEGAQSYGHGLYLAESPGVAGSYQRKLSESLNPLIDGAELDSKNPAHIAAVIMHDNNKIYPGMADQARESALYTLRSSMVHPDNKDVWGAAAKIIERGESLPKVQEKTGHLYTVDLPDEKIARMLDWDKPLSEQPEVIKALKGTDYEVGISQKEAEKIADLRLQDEANDWADMTGGDPVDYMNNANWEKYVDQVRRESGSIDSEITGKELHRMIMRDEGYRPELFDPENYQVGTSEALRGYGIPGIRYLDAASRDAGKGTSNFVVFPGEEDALTILERKKEGGEVKMAKGGSTSDELRRLLGGGMKDGGAAFGRYTTGKKYQKAVKQAKEADVNKLPDPRTYAFVSGLLGSAPDQLGFSVMHPDYKGIQKAGERGFVGGTVLGVAPAVAPLTRGLPVGAAIKPVGGNWLTGSVERALDPLKSADTINNRRYQFGPEMETAVRDRIAQLNDEISRPGYQGGGQRVVDRLQQMFDSGEMSQKSALNKWIDRNLGNYVKKQMATPDDPVRKLAEEGVVHIPSEQVGINRYRAPGVRRHYGTEQLGKSEAARAWEDSADVAVSGIKIKDLADDFREPWMAKADPDTVVYQTVMGDSRYFNQGLGFDHIVDVLKQDLDAGRIRPEQLNKVSMEQAVRRTYDFDQEMAKRMREAQIKATEGMPVHKEYPEGYRWIELTKPNAPENWTQPANLEAVQIKPNSWAIRDKDAEKYISTGFESPEKAVEHMKSIQGEKTLEDALKYEGDTMGHCVGGYCPDVLEGRSRIYSLRDAKGEPHVTVEVRPGVYTPFDMPEDIYPIYRQHMAEGVAAHGGRPGAMEWMQHFYPERYVAKPEEIVQIKGKQNKAPKEEYLPFVQDFVRSGKWSDVGDLANTGLYRANPEELGMFIPSDPALRNLPGRRTDDFIKAREAGLFGDRQYLTRDEFEDILRRQIESESGPLPPAEGMKAGGAVGCGCDDEPKMQAGGATSLLRGLLSSPAKKLTKAEMDALRAKGLGVPGQDFADVMNPADVMRMSEALGNAGAEGKTLNITQTDRSRVFGQNRGGPGFSGLQLTSVPHQQAGSTWGVGKPSHATRLINANTPDTIWSTFIGSPTQHMSNPVTVERIFKEHQKGNAPVDLIERMNQRLNDAVHPKTGKLVFPNGIDVSSPSALSSAQTFDQRKLLAETLAGKGVGGPKKGGSVVDAAKIIREETDPLLMGSPTYAVGPRLWTIDKDVGIYRPDLNAAFPYQVTGTDLGMVFEPTPIEMAALDFVSRFEGRKNKSGKLQPMGHKDLTATTPKQFVSDKYLTFLQKEGYADGGPVSGLSVLEKV
jgi:hypothetical protein